jgi:hypothetical protein
MGRQSRQKKERRTNPPPPRTLFVGREPMPAVRSWIAANPIRMKPGTVVMTEVWHDAHCRYPQGDAECTCVAGPEIRVAGENPQDN